jgi:hypothetical protein
MPLPTKDERNPLKVHYIIQVCFNKLLHSCSHNNFKAFSKFVLACPAVFYFRVGSLDVLAMLLHHTPSLEIFHGLLSMSSCTVCSCFCISASVSQLAYSTGWFFHLTRYSKYSFLLVLLLTLLSSMRSICGFSATGNYFFHWITGCSSPVSAYLSLYGYKYEILNIGEILIPSGNSIS